MIDRHQAAFREEANELLTELEASLLELETRPDDTELVQRVFRALHTLKGSGAMFGYDRMSHLAHELETVFDRVRDGQLAVSPKLVNVALAARDRIKIMLEEPDRSAEGLPPEELLQHLWELGGGPPCDPQRTGVCNTVSPPQAESEQEHSWRIEFRPAREILLRGTNPLLLVRELRGLGALDVRAHTGAIPGLAGMNPESCYVWWEFFLATRFGENAIRDVFIFVEDECELKIEKLDGPQAPELKSSTPVLNTATPSAVRGSEASTGKASIRVAAEKLDSLVNYVGELVTVQAHLSQLAARNQDPEVLFIAEEVERLTSGLRDSAMSIRMLPLRATFDRFRRLVRDLGRELGKEVELTTDGGDTELDKTVIDQLGDPLLHLLRNSIDHGVELPEERAAAGKPRAGRIHLSASHSGANVLIRVSDDGAGLNAGAVRARAIEKGLIAADAELPESDLYSLIFMPGFSTARQVTGISGRGVGMDVVRRSIEKLRGSVEIASTPGRGTTITLRLPLTLAIIDGLLVRAEGHFVLPLSNVLECIELTAESRLAARGSHMVNVRGDLVPYIRLREHFRTPGELPPIEQIMIVETAGSRYGIAVDEVLGDHQTVIKNLGRFYSWVQVVSGATILGDGTVALILDPERLIEDSLRAAGRSRCRPGKEERDSVRERLREPLAV